MSKLSKPILIWATINLVLVAGLPIWAYFGLLHEVVESRRLGIIAADGDTMAIPLMGLLIGIGIVTFGFNVSWGIIFLWLRVRRKRQSTWQHPG